MNYLDLRRLDIANGPGCRVSLFVSGCDHHCPGCFNEESWAYDAGQPFTEKEMNEICDLLNSNMYDGFSVLGGEPFSPNNIDTVAKIISTVREDISIWVWTGYTYEQIRQFENQEAVNSILDRIDVLVDGPFRIGLKSLQLQYCGSSNQRLLDIKSMRSTGFQSIAEFDQFDYRKKK